MSIPPFPLAWPEGLPRTERRVRRSIALKIEG